MSVTISNKHEEMDLDVIHYFLSEVGYWSPGISREKVEKAMRHSLPFGLFLDDRQIAYARVVSDYTTFAYLADVFVLPEHQGKGFSKLLLTAVHAHPDLQGLRRWMLKTQDAQALYRQFGWEVDATPERTMAFQPIKQS